ncbi:Kelch repeat-containing protein [Colwellia sp. RE-S-Sl-9]
MINLKTNYLSHLFIFFLIALSGCSTTSDLKSDGLSLSKSRFAHAAINDGKMIYVFGGSNKKGFLSSIEQINPNTNKIQVLKSKLIPRRYFSAVWDGEHSIYIIGGVSLKNKEFRYENRVEIFDTITHEVSFAKPLPYPTRINSAVFLNNNIFVFGGAYPNKSELVASALVSVYSVKQNKWMRAADMPTAKTTRSVVKDDKIYLVGGYNHKSALNVFEEFNPKTNKWISLPSMPVKMSAHSVTVIKDKLYTFGDYENLSSTYVYDFKTKVWEKVDLGYKASRHNAITTLDNTVYVIGGTIGSSGPFLDDIQIFNL